MKKNNNEWRIYSFINELFLTMITEPFWMLSIRQNHIPYISNILKRVLNVIFWVRAEFLDSISLLITMLVYKHKRGKEICST